MDVVQQNKWNFLQNKPTSTNTLHQKKKKKEPIEKR